MTNRVLAVLLAILAWTPVAQANDWSSGVPYRYDGAGNIKEIGTDRHVYDWAGRIVQSDTNGVRRTFEYDAYGNRTKCLQTGGTDCQYTWTINPDTNRIEHATYDAAGNVTQFDGHSYEYDAFNMQTRDSQGSLVVAEYIYTANDERIAVYVPGTGAWHWSLRDASGKVLREMTSRDPAPGSGGTVGTASWSWVKDYIYRDGLLLASRQLEPGATTPTTYHYHLDHLGTPRRITDDSGRIVGAHSYHAFGPELSDGRKDEPAPSRLKYTGHERDGELDYMHARYYDPKMGRFLSVDPTWASADLGTPQSWNRYSYVINNPINRTDPDGRCFWDVCVAETALVHAAGAALTAATIYVLAPSTVVSGQTNGQVMLSQTVDGAKAAGRWLANGNGGGGDEMAAQTSVQNWSNHMAAKADPPQANGTLPKPPRGTGSVPPQDRDPRRRFSEKEREAKRDAQQGQCANGCGKTIDGSNSNGHHVDRHADGGKTENKNHAEVCIDCHKELHSPPM